MLRQQAGMRQEPGARVPLREFIHEPARLADWYVVDRAERAVHSDRPRREQVAIVALLLNQEPADGAQRLFAQRSADRLREGRIDERVLGKVVHAVQTEIIGEEGADALFKTRGGYQSVDSLGQPCLRVQRPTARFVEQRLVGHAVPEQEGEAACLRPSIDAAARGGRAIDAEEEFGARQHAAKRRGETSMKVPQLRRRISRGLGKGSDLRLRQRPPVELQTYALEELPSTGSTILIG